MYLRRLLFTCGAVLALEIMATDSHADACKSILEQVKSAADRATNEMSAVSSSSPSSVTQIGSDRRRLLILTQTCTASAEAAGILKSYRIVLTECLGNRQSGGSDLLDELDRSLSKIRVALDKDCR
jgi:hypothetical protein